MDGKLWAHLAVLTQLFDGASGTGAGRLSLARSRVPRTRQICLKRSLLELGCQRLELNKGTFWILFIPAEFLPTLYMVFP